MEKMHPVQIRILRILSRTSNARFTDLNADDLPNDWFSFHIRKLKAGGFINKNEDGTYFLTAEGKNISLIIDPDSDNFQKNPKVSVIAIAEIDGKLLIQKRLIEPFNGYYEFPSHRVVWGKDLLEGCKEFFTEETGLTAEFEFKGIDHKIDYINKNILDDKYFFIFKAAGVNGQLKERFEEGENSLMRRDEILKLPKTHYDLENIFKLYDSKDKSVLEIKEDVKDY
jgi:ADP-ribose pyrophosphatase YjhB (NUDIX family)